MQIGESQFPVQIVILFLILIVNLFLNVFFFQHESFSIKYKLMRKHAIFRTNQAFALIVQILFKLFYVTPFLTLTLIAILRGIKEPVDLPIILVNGLIVILIVFPVKRRFYLWKEATVFVLTVSSQFVNLFVFAQNQRSQYYTLLCSIFYPVNSILFCLALLSKETQYWSIKEAIAIPKVYEKLKNIYQGFTNQQDESNLKFSLTNQSVSDKSNQQRIDQRLIRIPQVFDGGLFGYLRRGQGEGYNLKFMALYALSLCVLGVNAFTVWRTSGSGLGVIGLVTNFVYDLFVFAFNNLATPQRSVRNVFALVFVGRFLSFAFGEQLWIFGYCVLYFCVGTFVGQIIINDRLPLRNFRRPRGRTFEDALKTPEFVLFILTVEIVCLVAASSFGIASARTDVAYSEEVAVPLWQFAALMVGCTWTAILVLATVRIFRRKQNRIKADAEYYFGSERVKEYHVYALATYLLIIAVGLYCKFFLKTSAALYSTIFIPLIILAVIILILQWVHNDYKLSRNESLIRKRIQKLLKKNLKLLKGQQVQQLSRISIRKNEQKQTLKKDIQQQLQSQKQSLKEQPSDSSTIEFNHKVHNVLTPNARRKHKLQHYCEQWIRKTIILLTVLCAAFIFVCYFAANSIFGIFFVICLISFLSPLPFYRYAFNSQPFDVYQYIWFELGFVLGVIYWSFNRSQIAYAMIWAGINLLSLSAIILYGVIKRIQQNYFMHWLALNFVMTIVFICLFLAFTVPPFTAVVVSAILLLICLVLVPQAHAYYNNRQPSRLVTALCWCILGLGVVGLSLVGFILNFVSNFAVFTCVMVFAYLGLMFIGGTIFYQTEKDKYQTPHVYSAYGLPIYKFDSRAEKLKPSIKHKVFFEIAEAILVIYGAVTSIIYSQSQLAIYVLGYYCCSNFFQSMLFNLKTYSELGERKIDEQLILLTLDELDNKYMVDFKFNTHSRKINEAKYKRKSEAEKSRNDRESDERWKEVAQLDLEYVLTQEEEQKFLYLWILLIQFHINAGTKNKMVTFINYNKQIEKQLKAKGISLDSLSYALDFSTKFHLLCEEIDDLSHKDILVYKKMMCSHMAQSESDKLRQIEKGEKIKQLQKEKDEALFRKDLGEEREDKIKEFSQIVEKLGRKDLYVDRQFPRNQSSLGDLASLVDKWKRPSFKEELTHDQINVDYARQGKISNSYFISSIRVLGSKWIEPAFGIESEKGVKKWQNKKGAYMVRFSKFGKEVYVILDDYLPVDQHNQYVFAKSNRQEYSEIWPCILEKAYAKLYGGYQNIVEGRCHKVLSELSGGFPFELLTTNFQTNPYALWQKILSSVQNGYLMAAGSNPHSQEDGAYSKRNILYGHAYSILDAKEVEDNKLIKLKNPQFNYYDSKEGQIEWSKEWTGDFSDESQYMDARMMRILAYEKRLDGIFWMKLQDFMHQFRSLYLCKVFGDFFQKLPTISGEFTKKNSFGPPYLSEHTFKNPQYGLKVYGQCSVFVALTQEDVKKGKGKNQIYLNIYKAKGKRISKYNKSQGLITLSQKLTNKVVVSVQTLLKSETYPQTFTLFVSCGEEGGTGKYRLEIFVKGKVQVIDDDRFARGQFTD